MMETVVFLEKGLELNNRGRGFLAGVMLCVRLRVDRGKRERWKSIGLDEGYRITRKEIMLGCY